MSYQKKPIEKLYDGKTLVPITVAAEILEIRDKIEDNVQHAGADLELVYQAYCEIEEAHGHHPFKLDPTCSHCTGQMNKKLKKWFKLYDNGTIPQKAKAGAFKSKPLKPLKQKNIEEKPESKKADAPKQGNSKPKKESANYSEMNYAQLLKAFRAKATKEEQEEINNGNPPKKAQLVKYFNA